MLERSEVREGGFVGHVGSSPRCETTRDRHRLPVEVEIEIAEGGGDRWPRRVVQDDEPTWTNELPKKVQIDKDLVKAMAAVDKGRIGGESIRHESRERDRGRLTDQGRVIGK